MHAIAKCCLIIMEKVLVDYKDASSDENDEEYIVKPKRIKVERNGQGRASL